MKIYEIHDLSNIAVIDLLKNSLTDITDDTIVKNYHPDFNNTPGNRYVLIYYRNVTLKGNS